MIPASVERLREAREFAERAAAEFGLAEEERYHVRLAVSEAVTNAIEHGSSSPEDPVRLAAHSEDGSLVFEVADTGRFVPRVVRRGELPERGRGLDFMRSLMDEVQLEPGSSGTTLRLVKRAGA